MAKGEENEKHEWGTWEELLLACAVKRHGTKNWDSIAMEIQKRSSSLHFVLTPQNCKQKYLDLHRRFMVKGSVNNDEIDNDFENLDEDDGCKIPWLEELRKLRVVELRREVQRSDSSIVSLQLKVKRLKEEREQSLRESGNDATKSDPEEKNTIEENRRSENDQDLDHVKTSPSPTPVVGNRTSGENSDHENQESNSSGPKPEKDEAEKRTEQPVKVTDDKSDPVMADDKPASSCNGSSETIARKKSAEPVQTRETGEGESPELWDSVAEFKEREESTMKENSDVQSSTSLSRKNQRQKVASGSSSGGDEPETEEVSPRKSVESQPFERFLEMIRSHKYGTMFEHRLDSQETKKYKSLIRQHMDFEIVHTRLKEGLYSDCSAKFYRDVLLLFNNALVFFPKNSLEFTAAHELRQIVSKEMTGKFSKSTESSSRPTTTLLSVHKPEPEPEPSGSLLVKPKSSGPIVTSKKRSSITAKAAMATTTATVAVASVGEKKAEQKAAATAEEAKPATSDRKQVDNLSPIEQQSVIKKRKRDKSRSSRPIAKNQNSTTTTTTTKNSNPNPNQEPTPPSNPNSKGKGVVAAPAEADVEDDNPDLKTDKDKKTNAAVAKKRSAVGFLSRIKRTPSSNGALIETLKTTGENSNNVKGGDSRNGKGGVGRTTEQKKGNGNGKSDAKKGNASRHGSGKQAEEKSSSPSPPPPPKRGVGRPSSKRKNENLPVASSSPPPPPAAASSKRTREKEKAEAEAASKQPRKRTRR